MSPTASVASGGVTNTGPAVVSTVTSAVPSTRPDGVCQTAVAVTVATPLPIARTSPPSPSTATTSGSSDDQTTRAPSIGNPFASSTTALSRSVSPGASTASLGITVTTLGCRSTVTVAVPDAPPAAASMTAVPSPAARTKPDASTVATESSLLVQSTFAPAIAWPFWSCTRALSRSVSPTAVSVPDAGLTDTVVARGGSGGAGRVGSVALSPHERTTRKRTERRAPSAKPRGEFGPGIIHDLESDRTVASHLRRTGSSTGPAPRIAPPSRPVPTPTAVPAGPHSGGSGPQVARRKRGPHPPDRRPPVVSSGSHAATPHPGGRREKRNRRPSTPGTYRP